MLRAVFRQQGKQEIGVAKSRPGNIAGEFMSLGRFRRWFSPDLVVYQRDKSLERCIMIGRRVVALIGL